jgi:hypothetical protein
MIIKLKLALAVAALLGAPSPAAAAPIQWVVTGTVTSITPVGSGITSVQVGDTYTLTVTIDSAAPDQFPSDPNTSRYIPSAISLTIGSGYTANVSISFVQGIEMGQSGSLGLRILEFVVFHPSEFAAFPDLDGFAFAGARLVRLEDDQGVAVPDALILPTDVSHFERTQFSMSFAGRSIGGVVTSLSVVPEPHLAGLLLAGAAVLLGRAFALASRGPTTSRPLRPAPPSR